MQKGVWPWFSRSCNKDRIFSLSPLDSLTPKTYPWEIFSKNSDGKAKIQGGWYPPPLGRPKVDFYLGHLRVNITVLSSVFIWDPRPKKHAKQKKFIALAFLHPDIFQNVTFSIFWRSGGVKMTSFGVIWRHRSSLWLYWILCDIYLGKVTKGFWDIPIFHKTAIEQEKQKSDKKKFIIKIQKHPTLRSLVSRNNNSRIIYYMKINLVSDERSQLALRCYNLLIKFQRQWITRKQQ